MDTAAIRQAIEELETADKQAEEARARLRALVSGEAPGLERVGKRKPRPAAPVRERRPRANTNSRAGLRIPRRVAIVSVSAAYEAVLGGATTLDAVVAASRLSRPCARVALAQLVDEGRLRRSGATRAARWHLPTEVEPTGDNGEEDEG